MRKRTFPVAIAALVAVLVLPVGCGQTATDTATEPAADATPEAPTISVDDRLSALERMIETLEKNPQADSVPVPFLALSAAQVYSTLARHQRTESSGDLERLLASDNPRERSAGTRVQNQLQAEREIFEKLTTQLQKAAGTPEGAVELREIAKLPEVRRALKAMPPDLAQFAETN